MPKIATYEAPESIGLRPTETGINAMAAAARRVQGNYNEAAAAQADTGHAFASSLKTAGEVGVRYLEHREISAGAAAYSTMYANKAREWEEIEKNADPNDPTVAERFVQERLEPDLEKFRSAFLTDRGQQWAESHVASFRQEMFKRTSAGMAALAGKAAEVNVRQTVNALATAVQSDPASLDFALGTIDSATGGLIDSNPNLRGVEAAKLKSELTQRAKEQVVKAAAFGFMEKTGGQMPPWVVDQKYAPYMPPGEIKQFQQAAKFYARADKQASEYALTLQKRAEDESLYKEVNALHTDLIPNEGGDLVLPPDYYDRVRAIAKMPGSERHPGVVKQLVENGARIARRTDKPEPRAEASNAVMTGLISDIYSGAMTSNQPIVDAYINRQITKSDYKFGMDEFNNKRTPDGQLLGKVQATFIDKVKPSIIKANPLLGKLDPDGSLMMYRMQRDIQRKVTEYRKEGKDPYDLFDPSKPDYLGRPEALQQYQKSLTQSIADQAGRLGGTRPAAPGTVPVPPAPAAPERPARKSGESPADYLKRIGVQ